MIAKVVLPFIQPSLIGFGETSLLRTQVWYTGQMLLLGRSYRIVNRLAQYVP